MGFDRYVRFAILLIPALAGGCLQTSYRPLHQPLNLQATPKAESEPFLERRVDYRLADSFYTAAPRCAAILTRTPASRAITRLVENAVERQLAMRLSRVIGADRLHRIEASLGIDMKVKGDRRVFARQARCDTLVEIHLTNVQDDYMVLWAQRRLTISLTMRWIADGTVLWQARHAAGRADGGLPISIIDLPVSAARAVMVSNDPEMFASIADDAARRMMRTLPDIRSASPAGSGLMN